MTLTAVDAAAAIASGALVVLRCHFTGYTRPVTNLLVFDVTMCRLHIKCGDTFTKG